jgi:transcriptional regulator with PAS, ATPase and Fis domain
MNVTITGIKQRFGIIGTSPLLNRALDVAIQVAPTDLSVLITGESGVGKEAFPQIIHSLSARKHSNYIAVNCGAIPDGTIDSELFGHEKGAFTGAIGDRKGYFEASDKGTIFLDEVGELPISTQARLLRVLEAGEFIKVGSSKVIKIDVRIIAATNLNMLLAVKKGKFREDLFYRLNTIPIHVPSLRERKEDIYMLFRKFSVDLAEKYRMPPLKLDESARLILEKYRWPGNIRQLKNISEQISVIEEKRLLDEKIILQYLPEAGSSNLPVLLESTDEEPQEKKSDFAKEREFLYKALFDIKKELSDLKGVVGDIIQNKGADIQQDFKQLSESAQSSDTANYPVPFNSDIYNVTPLATNPKFKHTEEIVEESLSLADREKDFIEKALEKHRGRRKNAAKELGISERTLYRKIKEYNIS